jgi:hypothetical protein
VTLRDACAAVAIEVVDANKAFLPRGAALAARYLALGLMVFEADSEALHGFTPFYAG